MKGPYGRNELPGMLASPGRPKQANSGEICLMQDC